VPLRRTGLLLTPLATGAIALTGWVGPAAAPPPPPPAATPSATVSPAERYGRLKRDGAPVAVLRRTTVLRATPGGRPLTRVPRRTEWRSPSVLAAVGVRGAWLKVIASQLPNGRYGWIPAAAAQLAPNPWAVHADLSSRRVTVTRGGRVVRRFSVAVGRPATPTPTGRYAVTDKLELMSRSAAYGCCALALSGHQPRVAQGWAGGDRLAIHGTSEPQSIGNAASLGCLRARDEDARWLVQHVFLGTIVEIRP
jgi:lipoprotein-anchoring transpeptidase ErfK/SrfK